LPKQPAQNFDSLYFKDSKNLKNSKASVIKIAICLSFIVGAAFGGALTQINAATNAELTKLATVERELNANSTTVYNVYHNDSGEIVADYSSEGYKCGNMPVKLLDDQYQAGSC